MILLGIKKSEIEQRIKTSKSSLEKQFYQKYFGEIATLNNISLFKFYFPRNNCKYSSISIHKSINKDYLRYISMNSKFINEIKKYINEKLFEEEKNLIEIRLNNKIEKLKKKILKFFECKTENSIIEQFDFFINKKIRNNNQFKLPWSIFQLQKAIENVLDYIS